ncbi:hypothetical protein N7495_005237 [Penicillium taxi]|uniref:uncharacterized protein n=1 Tax=Penicillium taxi TaxID=168475 RepID=UPI002545A6A3|nr:uncharacterized protein N7495_005237 [Penicillium taxi]KAJ5893546.1 hypothetical protein N7495_005237 [Penicillium taxi]
MDNAISYERSIKRQAQIQTSTTAAEEAEETYKQARSIEKYLLSLLSSQIFPIFLQQTANYNLQIRLTVVAWIYIPLSFSASFFGMNVAQLNDSGPNIGYYFVLLAISLLISAGTAILYTEWWRHVEFAWREWIQPGHDCHPRKLSVAHLLWGTVRWVFMKKKLVGVSRRAKRRNAGGKNSGAV